LVVETIQRLLAPKAERGVELSSIRAELASI
jgi:hypothetical protein